MLTRRFTHSAHHRGRTTVERIQPVKRKAAKFLNRVANDRHDLPVVSADVNQTTPAAAPVAKEEPEPRCFETMEAFCAGRECPGYDTWIDEFRRRVRESPLPAVEGTCADLRFTSRGNGFVSQSEYFDEAGRLVAVRTTTDVITNQTCPGWTHYGRPLTCKETVTVTHAPNKAKVQ